MSNINIGTISGNNNIIGDNNIITNAQASTQTIDKVLIRDDYYQMMQEILDLERISLDDYLEDKYHKLISMNPDFVKILYKDIYYVLEGVDEERDSEIIFENGDFVTEYGDLKISGLHTNLHVALLWLHYKLVESFTKEGPENLIYKLEQFEHDFILVNHNTPSYTKKIKQLSKEIKKGKSNKWSLKEINEIFELKPNFFGLGINLNAILSKLIKK